MSRKRKKSPKTEEPPRPEDSTGPLSQLRGYLPFDLDKSWNVLRDEKDGQTLSRHADELYLSRKLLRLRTKDNVETAVSAAGIREVRMLRSYHRQGGFHTWHADAADYDGNTVRIATTKDAKRMWDFATNLARLINVPLAHGKNFHRRIPVEELKDSLWERADKAPLDTTLPSAPPGFEVTETDGAVELSVRDARKVSPVMKEWVGFIFASSFVAFVLSALIVAAVYSAGSTLAKVAPLLGVTFFLIVLFQIWGGRPRPRVVTTKIKVTTGGQVVWDEKAGGRHSKGLYDVSQYLDLSTDPAYFVSVDGEEQFRTMLDPPVKEPIGRWLEQAIIYCRAIHTGRRRQTILNRTDTAGVPASELLKSDPVPVKV